MLKTWRLKNFKSFGDQPPIELSAINVLAGANSSGKSSIIQSILLLKQTLQYGSENRPIALNGPLLRLGSFQNVLNHESSDQVIQLGFDIELTTKDHTIRPSSPWLVAFNRFRFSQSPQLARSISLDLTWQATDFALPLDTDVSSQARKPPRLSSATFKMTRGGSQADGDTVMYAVNRKENGPSEPDEGYGQSRYWDYSVKLDDASAADLLENKPESTIEGAYLSYFMPSYCAVRYNSTAQHAIQVSDALCNQSTFSFAAHNLEDMELPQDVAAAINGWLVENGASPVSYEFDAPEPLQVYAHAIRAVVSGHGGNLLSPSNAGSAEILTSLTRLRDTIVTLMIAEASPPDFTVEPETPRSNNELRAFITEYFKQGVRYLGPLRDSPRPVYQLEALEGTTDVGYRGEHTAAVLDLNKDKRVVYPEAPPNEGAPDRPLEFRRQRHSLRDAVVNWMVYLGVASDVRTRDAGVFGHQLQVTTYNEGELHDLTNVGVGVSQVLPIVVMSLLAHPGSLLIFEQPELHLHPKVQARLADFFILLALDGQQIFLETHSEYLVDRLRLRIAQAETDQVRSLINIMFSEKKEGQSKLVPIEVSEYGAVTNWPADFFEQSQRDVNLIIEAAMSKRRSQRTK